MKTTMRTLYFLVLFSLACGRDAPETLEQCVQYAKEDYWSCGEALASGMRDCSSRYGINLRRCEALLGTEDGKPKCEPE